MSSTNLLGVPRNILLAGADCRARGGDCARAQDHSAEGNAAPRSGSGSCSASRSSDPGRSTSWVAATITGRDGVALSGHEVAASRRPGQ